MVSTAQLAFPQMSDVSPGPNMSSRESLISQVDIQSLPSSLHPEISTSSIFKTLAQLIPS